MGNHHFLLFLFGTLVLQTVINGQHVCDFDKDLCNWNNQKSLDITWKRKQGKLNKQSFPDHTTGSGYYLHLEYQNLTEKNVAQISMPAFLQMDKNYCLSFYYYMSGKFDKALYIYRYSNDTELPDEEAIALYGSQVSGWNHFRKPIKTRLENQLMFEAHLEGPSDIAIDDVQLEEGNCQELNMTSGYDSLDNNPATSVQSLPFKCNFEQKALCGFIVKSGIISWKQGHGRRSYLNHGPREDHTFRTGSGKYLYSSPHWRVVKKEAVLVSPKFSGKDQSCLQFWYNMYGRDVNKLEVIIQNKTVWYAVGDQGFGWKVAYVSIKPGQDFNITFNAWNSYGSDGYIALDDIHLQQGKCSRPDVCNFERAMCSWTNTKTDSLDWVETKGSGTKGIGPHADHTHGTNKGTYLFLDAKKAKLEDTRALLSSEAFSMRVKAKCLHFWYHMKGNVGQLRVYKQNEKKKEMLWSLIGDQGSTWNYACVEIRIQPDNFYLVIEGIIGLNNTGGIAIDDLAINSIQCQTTPSKANLQKSVVKTTKKSITSIPVTIEPGTDTLFTCTFENGLCNWQQSLTDDFQWQLHQGYTPAKSIGPQGDHTTGSGHYLYIDTNGQTVNSTAQLYFLISSKSNGTRCLKFWYNMRGQHIDSLDAYVQYGTSSNPPIWTRQNDQGPNWQLAQIDFQEVDMADMKIIIEGKKGGNFVGNIAIDDISITSDSCYESYGRCDFESRSLCGYTLDTTADFRWKWQSAYVSQFSTAPTKDHTYGSRRGHYMYISQKSHKVNQIARLISPVYGAPTEDQCVQFYYNIYGRNVGSLNIMLRIHDTEIYDTYSYLEIKGDQKKGWLLGMVEVPKLVDNKFQIIFEGVIGKGRYGDIAIDDIEIKPRECEIGGDCDFDHGRCSWLNMASNIYDWLLGSGSRISSNTGPVSDHTLQNEKGFYLFIDATFLKKEEKTHFISRIFPALYSEKRCFTFWYSMNGDGIGILKILTKFDTGTNVTIWELSRNQGSEWLYGQAPIQAYTPYQIIIEVTRGRSFDGDIAIDDILFKDSDCSVSPHFATPNDSNSVIPTGEPPTNTENTKPFNCTFDAGLCGWSQDPDDDFNWTGMKGATPSPHTGPNSDHTGNNGYYLYIEASNQRYHQKARLMSPLVKSVGMVCMSVYYSMYGSDIKDFNIYITSGGNTPQLIFTRSGSRGRYWFQAQINFQTNSPFNVILEAVRGKGPEGDIAIDDVTIHEGLCSRQSTIGLGKFFNFENENELIQEKNNDFDWYLGSGSSSRFSSHPRKDHTYKTSRGHYMYLKSTSRVNPGNKAILSTPIYFSNKLTVCVTFWYFMYGNSSGTLRVQYLSEQDQFKSPKLLWMRKDNQGNEWNEANINIEDHADQHIKIEFVGIAGPGYSLNVAIDDVLISNKACTVKKDECHFENGKCEWQNKNTGDFDWVIGSGKYTTLYGPSKDHTFLTAAGKYLYLEPTQLNKYDSSVSQTNEEAILESQPFPPPTKQKCFEFYYYINKAENSSLQIFSNENEGDKKLLWQLSSNQGNNWMKGQTSLENIANSFRLMVKGIRGPRYAGDIALDDMKLTSTTPCKIMPAQASPTVTPKTTEY